jgi:hypothetical protein
MRRRKPTQTAQINVRFDRALIAALETRAQANRVTFSELVRALLINGLNPKPPPNLASFRVYFTNRLRDLVEAGAPKQDIEQTWEFLRFVDAVFAKLCGDIEDRASPYVRIKGEVGAEIRALLRGAPSLPDETKTSKVTQRE